MDKYQYNPITGNLDIVGVSSEKLKQILSTLTEPLVFAGTVIVTSGAEANEIAVHSVNSELTFTGPIVPDETLLSAVKCDPGWVWVVVTGGLSHELGQLNVGDNILIVSPSDFYGLHAEVLTDIVPIGYQFIGVADPTTNDNEIDVNVKCAWFAATAGTYTGLGNVVVDANELAVITRVASGGVASYAKVSLGKYVKTSDIVDDLETDDETKVLSAKQGKILNEQINGVVGFVDLSVTLLEDSYHSYNSILNLMNDHVSAREGTNCVIISCSPGDTFKIFGSGGTSIKLYAFTNDDREVLLTNTSSVDWHTTGGEVTAPSGSTQLYINFLNYQSTDKIQKFTVSRQGLAQRVDDCVERIEQLEDNEDLYLTHSDIVDNLNTEEPQKALSAKQGKILNEQINGVVTMQDVTGIVEHTYIGLKDSATYSTGNQISTEGSSFDSASLKVSCVPGDKFKIWGLGASDIIKLYAFVRQDGLILERSTYPLNTRENGIEVHAPDDAAYLYVNFYDYDSTTDKVQKYVVEQYGMEQRIGILNNNVEILSKEAKPVYKEKVFIAFGDSVTEFADTDGKRWTDYAEEILNCRIINCAIGGSHMNDPYGTELFDPDHSYAVGAYVFYKPDTTMNVYRCTNAHSGPWDDNDFEDVTSTVVSTGIAYGPIFTYRMIKAFCNTAVSDPYERFRDQIAAAECIYTWKPSHDDNRAIILTLVDADPDLIDAVIIAEGTNDYAATTTWGTSGSFDTTTLLGAINESIRLLNTTFKSMKVFYVTPTVRWYNYSGGTGIQSDFSDYYSKNSSAPKTFKEYVHEILMNEYINNHVPCVNLYDELQWTMYNFSNYFNDNDGTHPMKGFYNIAQKVASFLISNKNF